MADEVLLDGKPVKETYLLTRDGKRLKLGRWERIAVKAYFITWTVIQLLLILMAINLTRIVQNVSDTQMRLLLLMVAALTLALGTSATRRPIIIVEKVKEVNE